MAPKEMIPSNEVAKQRVVCVLFVYIGSRGMLQVLITL